MPGILAQCHLVFAGGSQVFDSIETTCEMENSKEPRMAVPRGTGILAGVGFQRHTTIYQVFRLKRKTFDLFDIWKTKALGILAL